MLRYTRLVNPKTAIVGLYVIGELVLGSPKIGSADDSRRYLAGAVEAIRQEAPKDFYELIFGREYKPSPKETEMQNELERVRQMRSGQD